MEELLDRITPLIMQYQLTNLKLRQVQRAYIPGVADEQYARIIDDLISQLETLQNSIMKTIS